MVEFLSKTLPSLFLAVLFCTVVSCGSRTDSPSSFEPNSSANSEAEAQAFDLSEVSDDGLGDLDPYLLEYAPPLEEELVSVEASDEENGFALLAGKPGAADVEAGVNQICYQNTSLTQLPEPNCFPPNSDGSFQKEVQALPDQEVTLWTNGDGFAEGSAESENTTTALVKPLPRNTAVQDVMEPYDESIESAERQF